MEEVNQFWPAAIENLRAEKLAGREGDGAGKDSDKWLGVSLMWRPSSTLSSLLLFS